jgi:hypothetical protein
MIRPFAFRFLVALFLAMCSSHVVAAYSEIDFCRHATQWLGDMQEGGEIATKLRRLPPVVQTALHHLDTAGVDSTATSAELNAIRDFARLLTEGHRLDFYSDVTTRLAMHHRPDEEGIGDAEALRRTVMADMNRLQHQLHVAASASRELSPAVTVFRQRHVLQEWSVLAKRASRTLDQFNEVITADWVDRKACDSASIGTTPATVTDDL